MLMKLKIIYVLLTILQYQNDTFTATVHKVIDGDTIEIAIQGRNLRIRLNGIDCPESSQEYGHEAKAFTENLVALRTVTIKPHGQDKYGRMIADVFIGPVWLNKSLIEIGLAWHYKRYSDSEELSTSEINARKSKIGLWQSINALEPWVYRVNNKRD